MNKSLMTAALVGGGIVLGGLAVGGYTSMKNKAAQPAQNQQQALDQNGMVDNNAPAALGQSAELFAQVQKVTPVKEEIDKPVEECHDIQVQHTRPVQDSNRVTGTVIGGLLGGVLGHQVGNGRGKDLATAAGAVAGGYAGHETQRNLQDGDKYTTTESKCSTVTHTSSKVIGYDVKYSLNGDTRVERRDHKPNGDRIPVKDGHLMWSDARN